MAAFCPSLCRFILMSRSLVRYRLVKEASLHDNLRTMARLLAMIVWFIVGASTLFCGSKLVLSAAAPPILAAAATPATTLHGDLTRLLGVGPPANLVEAALAVVDWGLAQGPRPGAIALAWLRWSGSCAVSGDKAPAADWLQNISARFQRAFSLFKDAKGPSAGQFNPSQRITPMHLTEPTMNTTRTLIARLAAAAAAAFMTFALLTVVVSLGEPATEAAQQLAATAAPAVH